ncbi:uncharacterized membrane protein YoaK (UPF0700 family) [Paraburkholderia youngii]|uniref:hypothetical protein n=1 Tax=Paraburkholderia youngii TaxID=2782701 RepID=UPI003D19686A
MLEASKIAFSKLQKRAPTFLSLVVFSIVVGIARGAEWKAVFGRLIPLLVLVAVFFIYQVIKARRILKGAPKLSRSALFGRFYLAAFSLLVAYFGIAIAWEMHGKGEEAFSILIPVLLFCVVLCGVALYKELGDLDEDFERKY